MNAWFKHIERNKDKSGPLGPQIALAVEVQSPIFKCLFEEYQNAKLLTNSGFLQYVREKHKPGIIKKLFDALSASTLATRK
jgi:hypothetical protein